MRHDQQYALYAAEASVPSPERFASAEEAEAWVNGFRDSWWWQRWYSQVKYVEVHTRPGRTNSVGSWHPKDGCGKMEMMRDHMHKRVLIHELSHVLAAARWGSHAHCPWFARVYLELVYLMIGPGSYLALHTAFERHGIEHVIDYTPDEVAL